MQLQHENGVFNFGKELSRKTRAARHGRNRFTGGFFDDIVKQLFIGWHRTSGKQPAAWLRYPVHFTDRVTNVIGVVDGKTTRNKIKIIVRIGKNLVKIQKIIADINATAFVFSLCLIEKFSRNVAANNFSVSFK